MIKLTNKIYHILAWYFYIISNIFTHINSICVNMLNISKLYIHILQNYREKWETLKNEYMNTEKLVYKQQNNSIPIQICIYLKYICV